jgi:hypothetical protein
MYIALSDEAKLSLLTGERCLVGRHPLLDITHAQQAQSSKKKMRLRSPSEHD